MVVGSPTILNLIPSGVMPVVYINQGDAGYDKEFLIYNGDSPYNVPAGVSATIRGKKADGYGVTEAAALTEGSNLVTVTITEQMVAAEGANLYELVFVDTDGLRIATINMVWAVKADALGDATISDSDLNYASQVMDQLQSVSAFKAQLDSNTASIEANTDGLAAETTARIAADNALQSNINSEAASRASQDTVLQAQIDQLVAPTGSAPSAAEIENARIGADGVTYDTLGNAIRNQFLNETNALTKTLYAEVMSLFETGSITANNGTNVNSSVRLRTRTYIDSYIIGAIAATGYEFNVYAYTLNGTYVGCLQTSGSFGTTSSVKYVSSYIFLPEYRYRVVLRRTDSGDITIDEYSNVSFLVATDKSLSAEYKSADAKTVGTKIAELKGRLIDTILGEPEIIIDEYSGVEWMEIGAINSSGANQSRTDSYRSDFLPCYFGSEIVSAMTLLSTSGLSYYHYICFYDSNKTFISREGGSKKLTVEATAPSNAAYYRTTLTYVGVGNVDTYSLTNTINNVNAEAPYAKWYVLGDSISAGYYSMTASMAAAAGLTLDYTSPVTTDGGETTGSVWDRTLEHNYWGYANKWKLHQDLNGLAIPGQGYFHVATYNSKNGVNVVDENSFSDAGLITVAWGFNDWHYNMVRGDHTLIDASVPYPGENYDTSQITTVNHAIWYCLGTLIRKAPNAKIIVQTPMNGWAYGGDWASNWGIGTSKSQSGTLADIHDDIVYWANYYGLQILEMTYNNSIVNRRNIKDTIIDGSHPSDAAHQQLGRHVAIALKYI